MTFRYWRAITAVINTFLSQNLKKKKTNRKEFMKFREISKKLEPFRTRYIDLEAFLKQLTPLLMRYTFFYKQSSF